MLFLIASESASVPGAWEITGIIAGAIAIAKMLWDFFKEYLGLSAVRKEKDEARTKQDRIDTNLELKNILDLVQKDLAESKEDYCKLEKRLDQSEEHRHKCDRKTEKMSAHIYYIEDVLRRSGIVQFRSWADILDQESKEHLSLVKEAT